MIQLEIIYHHRHFFLWHILRIYELLRHYLINKIRAPKLIHFSLPLLLFVFVLRTPLSYQVFIQTAPQLLGVESHIHFILVLSVHIIMHQVTVGMLHAKILAVLFVSIVQWIMNGTLHGVELVLHGWVQVTLS